MIARELPDFRGEAHAAIGQQDLGLTDAAGIKNDLSRRRKTGVVLISDLKVVIPERNPYPFAAPAHMDNLTVERQARRERGASLRREIRLELGVENKRSGNHFQFAHRNP